MSEKALLQREYRLNNPQKFREYYRKARLKRWAGKKCRLCGIALDIDTHGAYDTVVHCVSCSKDKRAVNTAKMQIWRSKPENLAKMRERSRLYRLRKKQLLCQDSSSMVQVHQ